ncbi:MAG: hypothetical protein QXM87_08640 [Candidatus Bathyarchaeia archaeon]
MRNAPACRNIYVEAVERAGYGIRLTKNTNVLFKIYENYNVFIFNCVQDPLLTGFTYKVDNA